MHARDETVIERLHERVPLRNVASLLREQFDDVRIAILCRRHRLDDVAGVTRMVVAVERDEFLATGGVLIGREKTGVGARIDFDELLRVTHGEALKELVPLVELERARVFFLIDDVRARARGDHDRSRRQFSAVLELDRRDMPEFVGQRFDRRQILCVRDAFLE